jgi:hypothetical protein
METKQTAMQTLMEWMIEESQVIPVDAEDTYNKAKELLVMEKEQLMDAYMDSYGNTTEPEDYYNQTYGK